MKLDDKFFKDKQEQIKIRSALEKAMPDEGVHLHNIIVVLADMLKQYTLALIKAMEAEEE